MEIYKHKHLIIKYLTIILLFLFHIQLNAQGKKLEDLSFLELEKKIDSLNSSNQNALPLIKYYIKNYYRSLPYCKKRRGY